MASYCSTHGDHVERRCPQCVAAGVTINPDLQDLLDEAKKQTALLEMILSASRRRRSK